MRRLTVEMTIDELSKFENNPLIEKIKSLEILQFLRDDPKEIAIICRVEFADPSARMEDFMDDDVLELQMLEKEKEGTYTYFIRSRPNTRPDSPFDPFESGGYLSVPFEINGERARMTYLGSAKQVRSFLEGIEKLGVKYRVVGMADAKFPQNSPLMRLTEKQRKVLMTAYRLGYYDMPRRVSSKELAERLNIKSSALIAHRRKAERRLLAELVGA
jgi:DNA-binding CsgD family transcriptional regulator